ncbi:MAG: cell division protein ZipA C-terminal FtsZ-binding domain-containing protein [Gammaproteobacteria bacterium]
MHDVTELRWILLAAGIAVIALVYWLSRRGSSADEGVTVETRREPDLGFGSPPIAEVAREEPTLDMPTHDSGDDVTLPSFGDDAAADQSPATVDPEPPVADKIVKLHLVAREGEMFGAADIVTALRAEGLRFAHFDLFHRFEGEGNPSPDVQPLFSVSNMLKPGAFDLEALADTSLRGISLFLVLPNAGDAVAVFADMLATGRRLAATLGGQLVDTQGCSISRQSASHMREDIISYQLSARVHQDGGESAP